MVEPFVRYDGDPRRGPGALISLHQPQPQRILQRYAGVFDFVDGANLWRAACPIVQVTDKQQIEIKGSAAVVWGVTFTAYPGSDGVAVHYMLKIPSLAS